MCPKISLDTDQFPLFAGVFVCFNHENVKSSTETVQQMIMFQSVFK